MIVIYNVMSIILPFVNSVTFNIVFVMTGATDSVTKYYQQSLAADARANASTSGPGNPVESSAILRKATEDKMNDTREEFHRRQEEHAKRLDDLAGQLETLDLSELSVKVSPSKAISEA